MPRTSSLHTLCLVLLSLACSACSGSATPTHLVTPTWETLAAQTGGPIQERYRLCRSAWTRYEFHCHRELMMWHNLDEKGFCQAWAKSQATEALLPGFTRSTRRCY